MSNSEALVKKLPNTTTTGETSLHAFISEMNYWETGTTKHDQISSHSQSEAQILYALRTFGLF